MTEWWWNERNNHLRPKKEGGPALASFRSERKREVYPPIPLCRGGWSDWLHACIEMNDQGMKEWEGNVRDESGMVIDKEALSLSAHPPLQRGMGGLTSRLDWEELYHSWMMAKWRNGGRMTGISEFSFFAHFQNHSHSSSFRHSWSFSNAKEWKWRKEGFHSKDIPFIFTPFRSILSFENVSEWRDEGEMSDIFEARQNP